MKKAILITLLLAVLIGLIWIAGEAQADCNAPECHITPTPCPTPTEPPTAVDVVSFGAADSGLIGGGSPVTWALLPLAIGGLLLALALWLGVSDE